MAMLEDLLAEEQVGQFPEQSLLGAIEKRKRPADPLRWAADWIGQNKDLPAPQFFMDPRALSARNMLHSALNTSANWLDGTRDPSLVGPAEMVSPTGLGFAVSAATSAKNALSRPGRDFRIADDLARQHPGASAVGDIPFFAPLRDAGNPTSAAHVADFGSMPGARATANTNRTPSEEIARAHALADENKARTAALADETKRMQDDIRSPEIKTDQRTLNMLRELDAMWRQPKYDETVRPFPLGGKGGPKGLMADNARSSAPGTVVNSSDTPADPPVAGETPGRPQMPEDMAPPSLDFAGFIKAMGAGAVDPFGLTSTGLNAMGLQHPARRLTEMRAEYPTVADIGGVLSPGGILGKAGGMTIKEFMPHLLGLAGQTGVLSSLFREDVAPLRPSPRAQAGYPREGAY